MRMSFTVTRYLRHYPTVSRCTMSGSVQSKLESSCYDNKPVLNPC